MPVETVPGTSLSYYLIAYDADGVERPDGGGLLSQQLLNEAARRPITDVFLMSHGWLGDVPAARAQYGRWIRAMADCLADLDRLRQRRPAFAPLLVGLHWPSQPWGDEELDEAAVSFEPTASEALVDAYAGRLTDTPPARAALKVILSTAVTAAPPPVLPPEIRAAYETLDREAGLRSEGVAAAPGADREPFDPEAIYEAARGPTASYGILSRDDWLAPLRTLSFWKMKDRARAFGESGGHILLRELQAAMGPDVRLHLLGHSFGALVVSAALAGPEEAGPLLRPVNSLTLLQGALSLWSYCSEIPYAPDSAGYFARVISEGRVTGPILTTQSRHDKAVGRWYPLAARAGSQVVFERPEEPKYGAIGAWGIRGPGVEIEDLDMGPADFAYEFQPGVVYNLAGSRFIREGGGFSGAHSDIARPEVAHAVWSAVMGQG